MNVFLDKNLWFVTQYKRNLREEVDSYIQFKKSRRSRRLFR